MCVGWQGRASSTPSSGLYDYIATGCSLQLHAQVLRGVYAKTGNCLFASAVSVCGHKRSISKLMILSIFCTPLSV